MSKKISNTITCKIIDQLRGSSGDIIIPNIACGFQEMDVFKLTPTGFVTEFEIKISRSDFKADFKKVGKHRDLSEGKCACNRFAYVTPQGLLKADEIPKYAGLYELNEYGRLKVVKTAPLIHKTKFTGYARLALSLSYREQNLRNKLNFFRKVSYNAILNEQE